MTKRVEPAPETSSGTQQRTAVRVAERVPRPVVLPVVDDPMIIARDRHSRRTVGLPLRMLLLHPGAASGEGLTLVTPDMRVAAGEGERVALTAHACRGAGAEPTDRGFPPRVP